MIRLTPQQRIDLAKRVVSHLPYCACGVTAAMLACAVFGADDEGWEPSQEHEAQIENALKASESLLEVWISDAGRGGERHFWITCGVSNRRRAAKVAQQVIDKETAQQAESEAA